jgi:hypothetical protein
VNRRERAALARVLHVLREARVDDAIAEIRTLLGDVPRAHRCPECGFTFAHPGRLADHLEVVHGVPAP